MACQAAAATQRRELNWGLRAAFGIHGPHAVSCYQALHWAALPIAQHRPSLHSTAPHCTAAPLIALPPPHTAVSGFGDCLLVPSAAGRGPTPTSQLFRWAGLHMDLPTNTPSTRSRLVQKLPLGLKHLSDSSQYY
jgi:hypothetical protein